MAGYNCHQLKNVIKHGDFIPAVEEAIPYSSAYRYMCLFEQALPVLVTNGTWSKLPTSITSLKVEHVYQLADAFEGRTLNELYLEFGIIKRQSVAKPKQAPSQKNIDETTVTPQLAASEPKAPEKENPTLENFSSDVAQLLCKYRQATRQ